VIWLYGIGFVVIGLGAFLAGRGHVRTAIRMRSYATTRGQVFKREIVPAGGETPRWRAKVTYRYTVDGVEHTSDKNTYVLYGRAHDAAQAELDAIPDEVDVFYDPRDPAQAYLRKHAPRLGYWLAGGGVAMGLLGLLLLFGAALG
jgi:hypothetical protein